MTTEAGTDRTINYAFLLGGLTAAIFGIILLIRREEAIGLLAILLGLWWLIQGAFMIFSVFIDREDWVWKVILGILGLTAGVVVLANPIDSATFLGSALAIFLGIIGLLIGISASAPSGWRSGTNSHKSDAGEETPFEASRYGP